MDALTLLHQAVLFAHLAAFAIAFSAVLREDLAVLAGRGIDWPRLAATARTLTRALALLWLTGLALLGFDVGLDGHALLGTPKALAKLVVVSALTANGLALHALVFPMLRGSARRRRAGAAAAAVLGAISSVSWLYASFLGVARLIAPAMSLAGFLALYAALLAAAVGCALAFVQPRVARLLVQQP